MQTRATSSERFEDVCPTHRPDGDEQAAGDQHGADEDGNANEHRMGTRNDNRGEHRGKDTRRDDAGQTLDAALGAGQAAAIGRRVPSSPNREAALRLSARIRRTPRPS